MTDSIAKNEKGWVIITVNGVSKTITGWAEEIAEERQQIPGIAKRIHRRIKSGKAPHECVSGWLNNGANVEIDGVVDSFAGHLRQRGISMNTAKYRQRVLGWDHIKIITTPVDTTKEPGGKKAIQENAKKRKKIFPKETKSLLGVTSFKPVENRIIAELKLKKFIKAEPPPTASGEYPPAPVKQSHETDKQYQQRVSRWKFNYKKRMQKKQRYGIDVRKQYEQRRSELARMLQISMTPQELVVGFLESEHAALSQAYDIAIKGRGLQLKTIGQIMGWES